MITITEVGPRDGLQNEAAQLSTEQKVELIRLLVAAGLRSVEATSFVHPRWIPALADAEAVMAAVPRAPELSYCVLIPNMRGYERACACAPDEVSLVCSASESHNRANLNRSTEESLDELQAVAERAKLDGIRVRGAISTSFWCPFEGRVPAARVIGIAERYAAMGADEVCLADTLGAADPLHVKTLVGEVQAAVPLPVSLHLHNTYGMALASAFAALEAGITRFDASVGGLGGCPYAPGAAGNVATEDLVFMLHRLGYETSVDEAGLMRAARFVEPLVGHPLTSSQAAVAASRAS